MYACMSVCLCAAQEAIVKILKTRKSVTNAALQTELITMLAHVFFPSRRLITEQIDWLIENNYMKRDEQDASTFIYVA